MGGEFKMFSDCFRSFSVQSCLTELSHHACTELSYSHAYSIEMLVETFFRQMIICLQVQLDSEF